MSTQIIELISSQGIWALLSFILISYILKAQEKRDLKQGEREDKYQTIISHLTMEFELINLSVTEIRNKLKKR
ncbi:BhlA/UviB family holin-like peptide [Clostridium vincentii]|uniref:Bacteriocin UviB n=1 Tax=Clostridium vincentii TaxID=52704 RepID=A0A2T0BHE1_9CLOT|nr:BhlA/UviB family holin-like peptide [Clostridium vincentii]PRR83247.1 Bacteriocin UviB precursor [Clostridium vincentii]